MVINFSETVRVKKIAIIGSGISGLTAAYYLNKHFDICLYEADSRLGGHTATKKVHVQGQDYLIDTGFIVFNDWTYPNFIHLMNELGVESQATDMGFSVFSPEQHFEYAGTNLATLFAQKRNLFSLKHWRMLRDIVRFNKEAVIDLDEGNLAPNESLGNYLRRKNYSDAFVERYLIPMGSAIWSATQGVMLAFPLEFFIRFFKNHGLLNITNRPQWRVIKGGSFAYIDPLTKSFKDKIKLNSPVTRAIRNKASVSIICNGESNEFDEVVFACHSDQALAILTDASDDERTLLGNIHYQKNSVVLHTDTRLLPQRKTTWSSWNYLLQRNNSLPPILTYSMNILQGIKSATEFCVTLNADDKIDPQKILGKYEYSHPVFSQEAMEAQAAWPLINAVNRTWFCGAYWFNGFHEDGVKSALRVVKALGVDPK
ncbi:amine oxidase [Cellvibrio zantedeschiae]|uniref:Amine oxidase n=1 Tax=Cellvibrio zantedeschiae TaxID=1237077 RepID=A0ABQ3B626_9GAMM|nr:amine oxidase [Cellvibrio zantedeschiae]